MGKQSLKHGGQVRRYPNRLPGYGGNLYEEKKREKLTAKMQKNIISHMNQRQFWSIVRSKTSTCLSSFKRSKCAVTKHCRAINKFL